mmetsp:Transcript_56590/g.150893  ORF Transcript_56590/g.150893 Transcript_56590/m.150893 type:complete len:464 (-) Transcript_56590:328-1719(-)
MGDEGPVGILKRGAADVPLRRASEMLPGQLAAGEAKFQPAVDLSKKTVRYRAGKVPQFVVDQEVEQVKKSLPPAKRSRLQKDDQADARLRRLAEAAMRGGMKERHREVAEAVVLSTNGAAAPIQPAQAQSLAERAAQDHGVVAGDDVEAEEDAIQARRERARMVALEKRRIEEAEQEAKARAEAAAKAQSSEEESSYETESESEEQPKTLLKPVFVPKNKRDTIKEKEQAEIEEEERLKREAERVKERASESKELLVEKIRTEKEAETKEAEEDSDLENIMPDDNDDVNEAEEYELWKIRELKRVLREKEERERQIREQLEVHRRRNMTDEERRLDDERLDKLAGPKRQKGSKIRFLQKYFHRGAFYQDDETIAKEEVYRRDFNEPVQDDLIDRANLPKPMQKRRGQFGFMSNTKYTHLTDQDTSNLADNPWAMKNNPTQAKLLRRGGGMDVEVVDRPKPLPK